MTALRILATLALLTASAASSAAELLNASYDVARPFYQDFNPAFAAEWKRRTGEVVTINQSHGGSSKQARAVIDGLEADVVSMNSRLDIDAIADKGLLLPKNWSQRLPHDSSPSWSAILFLVRKGNPKGIRDWSDLVKPGVQVVIPNPKTSGNGRYSYLAAWQFARTQPGGSEATARSFVTQLFGNVPVLDTGGRGATTTFAQRGIGDVLLTFENEVRLIREEFGSGAYEIVIPSLTVRADNPVALVDKVAARHGTMAVAKAWLEYHYSDEGQALFARNGLRPANEAVLASHAGDFPALNLFTVEQAFGGWSKAQSVQFSDGGLFDQIYVKK